MGVLMAKPKPPVFTREATGLIREVGAWPSFMAVLTLVTGGVPVLWVSLMYTAPGANWGLAFFIAFLPTLLMAGLFTVIGVSMPRSGGDYVFTTRGLNSFVGFVNYFGVAAAFIISLGIYSFYGGSYTAYLLSGLGAYTHDVGLTNLGAYLATTNPSFGLAIAVIVISLFLSIIRPRYAWGVVLWSGIITLVATVVMYVALAGMNATGFAASYNSFMGNATAYNGVIQQGGVTPPTSPLLATAAALPFVWYSYTWYNLPTSWSGEMKNVKKSMPIAIMFAITVVAVYYIMLTVIVTRAFGQPFLDNWSSLASTGSAPISGIGGFVPFFALLFYKNVPLYVIMFVALWVPEIFSLPPLLISQTRYVFAWSFDRILPDKMASVSERTHTPIIASIAVCIGGLLGAAAMAFLPNSGEFATLSFAMFSFGFIIPAIAAIVFPFRKKQIYETAFIAKKKFILPLVSWLGLGSGAYLVYSTILSYQSGSLPIDEFSMSMFGIIYGLGVLVYVVAYLRNRSRGLPLGLVFKEIPPE